MFKHIKNLLLRHTLFKRIRSRANRAVDTRCRHGVIKRRGTFLDNLILL